MFHATGDHCFLPPSGNINAIQALHLWAESGTRPDPIGLINWFELTGFVTPGW